MNYYDVELLNAVRIIRMGSADFYVAQCGQFPSRFSGKPDHFHSPAFSLTCCFYNIA